MDGRAGGRRGGVVVIAILSRKRSLYSTRRLLESAAGLGHETCVLDPLQCHLVLSARSPAILYRRLDGRLPEIGVVLPRIGASITELGLAVVNQFDMMGVPLVNNSQPIARSRDKLRCLQLLSRADVDIPRTVMVRHPSQVHQALDRACEEARIHDQAVAQVHHVPEQLGLVDVARQPLCRLLAGCAGLAGFRGPSRHACRPLASRL